MSDVRWTSTATGAAFETDLIRGDVIADGERFQVANLIWKPSGLTVDTGMALAPYRLLARDSWMGEVRQMLHERTISDGGVSVAFGPGFSHQAELRFRVELNRPDAIDVSVDLRPFAAYPNYELLISAYLAYGFRPGAYIGPGVRGETVDPVQVRPVHSSVYENMYVAFPRDEASAAIISDGRWQRGRHHTRFAPLRYYALPVAFSAHEPSALDVLLMAPPEDVFSVAMAYHSDNPADDVGQHRSLYLSLFGRDITPGQRIRTAFRLQVGEYNRSPELHQAAVNDFLGATVKPVHLNLDTV